MKTDAQGRDLSSDRVFLVKRGIIGNGWVCAPRDFDLQQVEDAVQAQVEEYCDGTRWTACGCDSLDPEYCSPGACAEDPARQHWLVIGGSFGLMQIALCGREGERYIFPDGTDYVVPMKETVG